MNPTWCRWEEDFNILSKSPGLRLLDSMLELRTRVEGKYGWHGGGVESSINDSEGIVREWSFGQ